MPTIYRYQGRIWQGGFARWETDTVPALIGELFWLMRHGTWCASPEWPRLIFGFGRMWYDGPHWHLNLGLFSVSIPASI